MKQFAVPVRRLLKENVDAIREKRGLKTRKDLAVACHKSESWISKIYREDRRSFGYDDLNRIAEVLGVEVYHLFQRGFSKTMERRRVDRRTGQERRIGAEGRELASLREETDKLPRTASHGAPTRSSAADLELQRTIEQFARDIAQLQSGRQAPASRATVPVASERDRKSRGPDSKKA